MFLHAIPYISLDVVIKGRMKTLSRYTITVLVALAAFLPVFRGAFPQKPVWAQVCRGLIDRCYGDR